MRRFVVIEGLIGAGKSSLARLLRDRWGARLVLEPAETNPFLEPYYEDPVRYAFPVQMFYLVNRWRQQESVRQQDLFSELVVSDYLFAKDRLFAEKTLSPVELELYDRFAEALGESAPVPDLLIWLDAPIEVHLQRIAERRAPGEQHIAPEYLVDLRQRYERLLSAWSACPVLRVDNRGMDYVRRGSDQDAVLELIAAALEGRAPRQAPGSIVDREAQPDLFGAGESHRR